MDALLIFLAGFTVALLFGQIVMGTLYTLAAAMVSFRGPGTLRGKWRRFRRAMLDFPHGF